MPAEITIVVPAYNASAYLPATIGSALAQKAVDVSVIVVDDGSTDDTAVSVLRMVAADPRVRLLQQPNAGVGAARNHGVAEASTAYVGFLDADDVLEPGWAEAMCAELDLGAAVAVGDAYFFNGDQREAQTYYTECAFPHTDQATEILQRNFVLSTAAARKEAVLEAGGFPDSDEYRGVEDYGLWLSIVLAGGRVALVPRVLSGYRRGHSSMSSNVRRMNLSQRRLLRSMKPRLQGEPRLRRALRSGLRAVRLTELLHVLPSTAEQSPRYAARLVAEVAWITRRRVHVKAAALLLVVPSAGRRYLRRIL